MRVTLETSGGYAGLRRTATVDTDDLPEETARGLDALAALAATAPPPPGPQPRYRLTIYRPTGPQVVDLAEPHVPEQARPLLTELLRRARG